MKTRMTTVTRKPRPHPSATNLSWVFSMLSRMDSLGEEKISSEVIRRIMAVAASQRLTSDIDRGRLICLSPAR